MLRASLLGLPKDCCQVLDAREHAELVVVVVLSVTSAHACRRKLDARVREVDEPEMFVADAGKGTAAIMNEVGSGF